MYNIDCINKKVNCADHLLFCRITTVVKYYLCWCVFVCLLLCSHYYWKTVAVAVIKLLQWTRNDSGTVPLNR